MTGSTRGRFPWTKDELVAEGGKLGAELIREAQERIKLERAALARRAELVKLNPRHDFQNAACPWNDPTQCAACTCEDRR